MTDPVITTKAWMCDVDDIKGKRTLAITAGAAGSWEITSKTGISPWVAGMNGVLFLFF